MAIKKTYLLILGITFGGLIVSSSILITLSELSSLKFTLLDNEGVVIEADGLRIYIDPILLPSKYENKPADVILVTHPHNDHYAIPIIEQLQKEGTINIFPNDMSDAIELFNGTGVDPEDEIIISDGISITAFYMYTDESPHAKEYNWTSYLIDIHGFVLFHAGDSDNITEYELLQGMVDFAMLPLVPNLLMTEMEIVDAINTIQPRYVMLFHSTQPSYTEFYESYGNLFEATFLDMDHRTSHRF